MSDIEIKNLEKLLDFDNNNKKYILDKFINNYFDKYNNEYKDSYIDVSNEIYKDTNILKWSDNIPILDGSKILLNNIIKNPINNKELLLKRQKSYFLDYDDDSFDILKEYENDILWIYKLNEEINNDNAINILFPTSIFWKLINEYEYLLDSYHIYRILFVPLSALFYPLTAFFAPYYYVKKYLKFDISVYSYFSVIKNFFSIFFQNTGNFKYNIFKFIVFCLYIFLYLYSIYQNFEFSYMLYKTKKILHKKMQGVINFINESNKIINYFNNNIANVNNIISCYVTSDINYNVINITNTMTNIYKFWKNKNNIKDIIDNLLITIYTLDIINQISKTKFNLNYSFPQYNNQITQIWNMKNPLLSDMQISNPLSLNKNIIITGPNAAGKTTYVKSLLSNIILSQTIGLTYSNKSLIKIYDCIYSFMRINDELGSKSYFEAEAELCAKMINKSIDIQNLNKSGIFFMDEPMHSTPPIEGISTAYAVCEKIGTNTNVDLLITTHFFKLTTLENTYPYNFINLSVNAIHNIDNTFTFPYKIKKGSSNQCIAIELLDKKNFPEDVINSAKNIKKIICNNYLD
tara:strand:+ start:3709 stop:5436 length:1728 start_codon:yes stop_codon:yes gene_type:complete